MEDAGSSQDAATGATGPTTQWSFNWTGLVTVLLIVSMVVVLWRWLPGAAGDSGDDASDGPVTSSSAPADPAAGATPTTTTGPTTTVGRTTVPAPTTTAVPPEREVRITGELKPCRFGDSCLVASFSIVGFDDHPGRYVCVFPNSRYDFSFRRDQVDDACMTAQTSDSISIEVAGVESATISADDLDGT